MEQQSTPVSDLQSPVLVARHRYPIWLVVFTVLVVYLIINSLILVPPYWDAARELHRGEQQMKLGDRGGAEATFSKILQRFPTSKSTRMNMAVLLFSSPSEVDNQKAVGILDDVRLQKDDWKRLSAVMPAKYRSQLQGEVK